MGRRNVVMAVSSSGGHWSQLMLLRPAFEHMKVVYISTQPDAGSAYGLESYYAVPDCNRNSRFAILTAAWVALKLFWRVNPGTIISTGALPGLFMIFYGRLTGRKTIWVDSIANSERLSMCGAVARWMAHRCFVQWPELAAQSGALYAGSVL